jgi:hypothetical protein
MKIKYLLPIVSTMIASGISAFAGDSSKNRLVVHEWGTFTSVQGGEGELLDWKPLETPELPKFVYDWKQPAPGRRPIGPNAYLTKSVLVTLQRMETPVLYFYTDKEQTIDLTVRFPSGMITEWFPQAQQMGPSVATTNPAVTPKDMQPSDTFSRESMIRWRDLQLIPMKGHDKLKSQLPLDPSGNRYLAARETDSAYLRSATLSAGSTPFDYEKFLFYRGAGSFATPLRASMKSDDAVTLVNNGKEDIAALFVLRIKNEHGSFEVVRGLKPGEPMNIQVNRPRGDLPLEKLSNRLAGEMATALTQAGLYPREAKAMVNTWKDSWFQEDGVRVLYLLPRVWTDQTLPLTMNPKPAALVRIMVGRAEVLTPEMETTLAGLLEKAKQGDANAEQQTRTMLRALGRFAEPAFYRAFAKVRPEDATAQRKLLAILTDARNSP